MSKQPRDYNEETLFSFELFVKYICVDKLKSWKGSEELALGVRLLDFPTLLIYQPESAMLHEPDEYAKKNELYRYKIETHGYVFNKGKSCLFKINLDSLHTHLSNTPLYTMVLDMSDEIPKLLGTSQISLAKLINQIRSDVEAQGISTVSAQGEKTIVGIFNLMGQNIGFISLGYKLISLGSSLLTHIPENTVHNVGLMMQSDMKSLDLMKKVPSEQKKRHSGSDHISGNSDGKPSNVLSQNNQVSKQLNGSISSEVKLRSAVSISTQTEDPDRKQTSQRDGDPATDICPHLHSCSAEQDTANQTDELKLFPLDLESVQTDSLDPSSMDEMEDPEFDPTDNMKTSSPGRPAHETAPSILGEAVRQLPLLNALLVELSQLDIQGQTQQQPLSIHPNLAWIYRPATQVITGPASSANSRTMSPLKIRRSPSPSRLRSIHPPGNLSTSSPQRGKADVCSKGPTSPSRRLVYGTTKTFRLRMTRVTPVSRHHECTQLLEQQRPKTKAKQSSGRMFKCVKSRAAVPRSAVLDENIETLMSSDTAGFTQQETLNEEASSLRLQTTTQTQSKPDRKLLVRIPSVQQVDHSNQSQNKDKCDDSELNQAESRCYSVRGTDETPSVRSGSRNTSHTNSSLGGADEYPDDFSSLDPVEGCSPDPLSDPKPGSVQAGGRSRDPSSSDSYSDTSQRKMVLPMPIKAPSSPHRTLRGTRIIRPHTRASALSLSSETSHGDRPASNHSSLSLSSTTARKVRSSTNRASVLASLGASESQFSDSVEESSPVRGYSMDTNISLNAESSSPPQEAEENRDELGSLGFRNRYQHISELVANKLPGYTL